MESKMIRLSGFDPQKVYQGMANLHRRGIIKKLGGDYVFTKDGLRWLKGPKMMRLWLASKKWDKKWRIVIFDIPENLKNQRDLLRHRLKSLNFFMLQKSVFVCPFPCEEELGDITDQLRIGDYVDVAIAESVGFRENEIKRFYDLD